MIRDYVLDSLSLMGIFFPPDYYFLFGDTKDVGCFYARDAQSTWNESRKTPLVSASGYLSCSFSMKGGHKTGYTSG